MIHNSFDGIDFENSIFHITNSIGIKKGEIEINSLGEFNEKIKQQRIKVESLIIQQGHDIQNQDIFFFRELHSDLIADSNLIDALINSNITGIEYREPEFGIKNSLISKSD
ncbi:MAG: hypothetical protein JKX95_05080, partial [Bacteroidia bacterium]|nr:hypothetical protein [Bacteroidia bacterium]